jgi:uncharacterized protein (DUF1499 family)
MRHLVKQLLVLGIVIGAVWAATAWPRINDVETGKTPEYPDLKVKIYSQSPEKVAKAGEEAIRSLPRWTLVGQGKGPGGYSLQAVHETKVFHFKDEVTIEIRREGQWTKMKVRSRSRKGKWDFGQNARNIRELLAEVDRHVF